MIVLLFRPPKGHYAHSWGIFVQLQNGKKWLVHYDNVTRGNGLSHDEVREMKNHLLNGEVVKAQAEWAVKVEKVLEVQNWQRLKNNGGEK
ncbi:MAG: hypothetical protein QXK47_02480 [Candidatus Bathyarchaeia archaeon]